jgi:hypothetical protein
VESTNDGNNADKKGITYRVKGVELERIGDPPTCVANFHLTIASQRVLKDEGAIKGRVLDIHIHTKNGIIPLRVFEKDFLSPRLYPKVMEMAGAEAILYGSAKDLQLAAQELSPKPIPEREVYRSLGFQPDATFLSKGALISPKGMVPPADKEIDLSGCTYAQDLGFKLVDKENVARIAKHLVDEFLKLKQPKVMFPLIGHTMLAAFSSQILPVTGHSKPALHLQGVSGSGKTFLANLAMRFHGNSDRFASWQSTVNALEVEGYYFRDSLFVIDDYKTSVIEPQSAIKLIQKYADERGRLRLKPNAERQGERYIRGLLLSTGEDFISSVESILGRTIVIEVEKKKDEEAGRACWANRHDYATFLPYLIQLTISDPDWRDEFQTFVESAAEKFKKETLSLSNGLRISGNWALNAWGFRQFLKTLADLKVLNKDGITAMQKEYLKGVTEHLREQSNIITNQSPAMVMFEVLGEKLATGAVSIDDLSQIQGRRGRLVGKAKLETVYIFPNATMELLASHFRQLGQRIPFTAKTLRDALADEELIQKGEKRWTSQVRVSGGNRQQGWQFARKVFEERCGLEQVDEKAGQ